MMQRSENQSMLDVGLNPYGLTYYLGLQGRGTPRVNPDGRGLEGFIELAEELGAHTLEIAETWLAPLDASELRKLRDRLGARGMNPVVSSGLHHGDFDVCLRAAKGLDAR